MKQHYIWVDYAKFLGIFVVVYFHCPPVQTGLPAVFIRFFMMPCFYFLSGFLFRFENYPSFLGFAKHRSKQLLIPYFCFFILFYIYWMILGKANGTEEDLHAPLWQPVWEYLYGRPNLICTPLWFISCLFLLQSVFYGLHKLLKQRRTIVVVSFITPFIPLLIDLSNSPWMLENVCFALPFYSVASLYNKEIIHLIEQKKAYLFCLIGIILSVVLAFIFKYLPDSYLKEGLHLMGSFSILFSVFVIANYLSGFFGKIRWVEYLAANAVIILAVHTYLIRIITLVVSNKSLFEEGYIKLVMAIVIMAVMIIPIYIINRYFPFIIGRGKHTQI